MIARMRAPADAAARLDAAAAACPFDDPGTAMRLEVLPPQARFRGQRRFRLWTLEGRPSTFAVWDAGDAWVVHVSQRPSPLVPLVLATVRALLGATGVDARVANLSLTAPPLCAPGGEVREAGHRPADQSSGGVVWRRDGGEGVRVAVYRTGTVQAWVRAREGESAREAVARGLEACRAVARGFVTRATRGLRGGLRPPTPGGSAPSSVEGGLTPPGAEN